MKQGVLAEWQHKYDQDKHRRTLDAIGHRRPGRLLKHSKRGLNKTQHSSASFELQLQNEALLKKLTAIAERKPVLPQTRSPMPLRLGFRKLQAQQLRRENKQLVDRLANPEPAVPFLRLNLKERNLQAVKLPPLKRVMPNSTD